MAPPTTTREIHAVNLHYHDLAAANYDAKWGIDYGRRGRRQVIGKLHKALDAPGPHRFRRGLEIGAGTGYFGLNLVCAGALDSYVGTDISPGMLERLEARADELGLEIATACCDAARLPFADGHFDIAFGHAVLHHLPDLEGCLRELRRVLRPGGVIAFCGEPSRHGDRLAELPKRAAHALSPAWRALVGASPPARNGHREAARQEALEALVDVHAFTPQSLTQATRGAGFEQVRVHGEELTASLFGWANRALEATAEPAEVPWLWHQYAYRGYMTLQALDRVLLEPRLPAALFYNLLLSARAPAG